MGRKVRVLIVDDSALRQALSRLLSSDPETEAAGTAPDPFSAAAKVRAGRIARIASTAAPKLSADVVLPPVRQAMLETTETVVAIGASAGGTEALRVVLERLPTDCPGMVIAQHMPELFTRAFAERLDRLCRIPVKEAEQNDSVLRGRALMAPGGRHLLLKRSGARSYVEVREGPLVSRHGPPVDVSFRSAARNAGADALGIILTGMGDDEAKGLLEMKENGASTIAQVERSCVIFGMPNEAIKQGAADQVLPLDKIPMAIPARQRRGAVRTSLVRAGGLGYHIRQIRQQAVGSLARTTGKSHRPHEIRG